MSKPWRWLLRKLLAFCVSQLQVCSRDSPAVQDPAGQFYATLDVFRDVATLRDGQGVSLLIVNDNEEAWRRDEVTFVEIVCEESAWRPRQFYGPTWQTCVALAAAWVRDARTNSTQSV